MLTLDDIFDEFLFSTYKSGDDANTTSENANKTLIHSKNHLGDASESDDSDDDDDDIDEPRKRARGSNKSMTEQQKVERR